MHNRSVRSAGSVRVVVAAALALAIVPLANCTSDSPTTPPAMLTIGPEGGALASSDYVMEILVPAGALQTDVTFTITPVAAPAGGTVAPAYTITSDTPGLTFLQPAVISFTEEVVASPVTPAFNDPSDYRVAAYDSSAWALLTNQSVDALADTIEGTTTTLSAGAYSVVIPAAGATCETVTASQTCDGDAGCTAPTCDPVLPGKCAAYPGAVAETCTVNAAGTTMTTSCCYPSGQDICVIQVELTGCNNPCSNYPGAVATSCVPNVGPPLENGPSTAGVAQSTCCFPPGASLDGGLTVDASGDASADAAHEGGEPVAEAGSDANANVEAGLDASESGTADSGTDAAADAGEDDASNADAGG